MSRYEIRDPHLVEENVMQILKEKADFDSYKPRPFNMREFYDRTGHDIRDMLLSCSYRGSECRAEDFQVVSQAQRCVSSSWPAEAVPKPGLSEHVCTTRSMFYSLLLVFMTTVEQSPQWFVYEELNWCNYSTFVL